MQGVGLDRVDRRRALQPLAEPERQTHDQAAGHRPGDHGDRVQVGRTAEALVEVDAEQQLVGPLDQTAHQHHQDAGPAPDDGGDARQRQLARAHRPAQPRHQAPVQRQGPGGVGREGVVGGAHVRTELLAPIQQEPWGIELRGRREAPAWRLLRVCLLADHPQPGPEGERPRRDTDEADGQQGQDRAGIRVSLEGAAQDQQATAAGEQHP